MAEERVDRARKMVRRILFRVVKESDSRFMYRRTTNVAEIIYPSTPFMANPSSSSISMGHISRLSVLSTNASVF
jgi:hypothetical protein